LIEDTLKRRLWKLELSDYITLIMASLYSTIFSYYTIMRHYSFRSNAWDLGILVQSIASGARGTLFVNNVERYYSPTGSYFGVHFTPILYAVTPFFYLLPKVETILVLQSIVLGLGAIPIYLMAKQSLNSRLSAVMLSIAYLMNPLLQGINWYDFHTQAFFPLFILSATCFLKKRRLPLFLLFLFLSLTTMEQASFLVALYSIYTCWEVRNEIKELIQSKKPKLPILAPLITILLFLFWIYLSHIVKYSINPNPPPELKAGNLYKILEIKDPAEIPAKVITNPELALKAIRFDFSSKILYIMLNLAPSCFLVFLSPLALLPSLPWLLLSILSNHKPYYQLGFQYTAFTLPFISIATIDTIQGICSTINGRSIKNNISVKISVVLLVSGLFLSIFASPLSFLHKPGDFRYFRDYGVSFPSDLDHKVMNILETIPSDAVVITTSTIFPHISTDINAYVIPPIDTPSRRLFQGNLRYLKNIDYDYICYTYFWDKSEANILYDDFVKNKEIYGLFMMGPGIEVYKKGYKGSPIKVPIRLSYKELVTADSVIVDDPLSESGKIIMLKPSPKAGRYMWYGPYITLLPGNYTANFRIKIDNLPEGKVIKLEVWSNSLRERAEIASYEVNGREFSKPFVWHTFSLPFSITERTPDVEFRGIEAAGNLTICLDYVEIIPH